MQKSCTGEGIPSQEDEKFANEHDNLGEISYFGGHDFRSISEIRVFVYG